MPDIFTLLLTLLSTEEKQVLKATMVHYTAAMEHGIQYNNDAKALWPEPLVLFNPNFEVNPNTDQGAPHPPESMGFHPSRTKIWHPKNGEFSLHSSDPLRFQEALLFF